MKMISKLLLLPVLLHASLSLSVPFGFGEELIEPTRTLEGADIRPGRISVFSEPPGLDVFLDNSKIGQTPILSLEVGAGVHKLRIKESETDVFVEPGGSLQLSLHKGTIIRIAKKKKGAEIQRKSEKEKTTEKTETLEPTEERQEYQPLYWPLNPRGHIW